MLNFAGPTGNYRATLLDTGGPIGMCPVVSALDNGANSFLQAATPGAVAASPLLTRTIKAN